MEGKYPKVARAKQSQQFTDKLIERWRQLLTPISACENVFLACVKAPTPSVQLKEFKVLTVQLQQLQDEQQVKLLVQVLSAMHTHCLPRHPLQRAIGRVLMDTASSRSDRLVHSVLTNQIKCVVNVEESFDVLDSLNYLETMTENFSLGFELFCTVLDRTTQRSLSSEQWDIQLVETVTTCCKVIMIIVNKYSEKLRTIVVGMETGLPLMEWQHPMATATEKQSWLKEKLTTIENILMNLLQCSSASCDMLLVVGMTTAVLWKTLHQTATMVTSHAHMMLVQSTQNMKPFSQLCLTYGVLTKFPVDILVEKVVANDKPFFIVLYDHLSVLNQKLVEVSGRFNVVKALALWITTARLCAPVCPACHNATTPNGTVMTSLLQCVWSQWDDPVEGIRYQVMEIFDGVVNLYQTCYHNEHKDFIPNLLRQLVEVTWRTRGKYVCLQHVLTHIGDASQFLELSPSLPSLVLKAMEQHSVALCAGHFWSKLAVKHHQEVDTDKWLETWVDPLLEVLQDATSGHRTHVAQYALPAVLMSQDVMDYIKMKLNDVIESVSIYLLCLRQFRSEHPEITSLSMETIGPCLCHIDDQVRIDALGLLCESKKTTNAPSEEELQLVLSFMEYNMNSQSPQFRQQMLTLLKKLLIRIRECGITLAKKCGTSNLQKFKKFLVDYFEMSITSLFPGSSFQRRQCVLHCLTLLATLFDYHIKQAVENGEWIPSVFTCSATLTNSHIKQLLCCLQDTYVGNKILALELLTNLVSKQTLLEHIQTLIPIAHEMMCGSKSADCSSSAYHIKLFMIVDGVQLANIIRQLNTKWYDQVKSSGKVKQDLLMSQFSLANRVGDDSEVPVVESSLHVIAELMNFLQLQLSLAEHNLLQASVETPVYGVLEVIRIGLECVDLKTVPDSIIPSWREMLSHLIEISTRVAQLVTPVVCNSSPEGCLPDENIIHHLTSHVNDSQGDNGATAQSLVICCWHCMKEVSLLLGDIVERAPLIVKESDTAGLITVEQILNIGKLFTYHLMEAKHMGAFEMAYAGFQKLCGVLWASTSPQLLTKPLEWAKQLLDSFKSQHPDYRVTRRSAGVPFYLQAILSAEPDFNGRSCLRTTMTALLDIASSSDQPDDNSLQPSCVHALNILRALFRESRLGDHVMPFVASGFKAALFGISSHLWAVRNSSTLLFSALMTRVFGVKQLSDEHSQENKMASRQFFTKFPSLHSFLITELDTATSSLEAGRFDELQPSLFPMLLLLARLYPSTFDDGGNPSMSLRPFIPLVLRCAKSSVWKIREAAARALLSMSSQTELRICLDLLYSNGLANRDARHNHIHGLLLMLHLIVMEKFPKDWENTLATLNTLLNINWIGKRENKCPVTRGKYLQILATFFDKISSFPPLNTDQQHHSITVEIQQLFCDAITTLSSNKDYPQNELFLNTDLMTASCCYCYHLLTCAHDCVCDEVVMTTAANLLHCSVTDHISVQFVLMCLQHTLVEVSQCIVTVLRRKPLATDLLPSLVPSLLTMSISVSNVELLTLVYELLVNYHDVCFGEIIAAVYSENFSPLKLLQSIIKLNQTHTIKMYLKEVSIMLASYILFHCIKETASLTMLVQWIGLLKRNYGPSQPESLCQVVANALGHSWRALLHYCNNDSTVITEFWSLLVELLQDYNVTCRNVAAKCVTDIQASTDGECWNIHPHYCLSLVFSLTRHLHGGNCSVHQKIVLQFLITTVSNAIDTSDSQSNILFIEGPINDYKEEVILVRHACRALKLIINDSSDDPTVLAELKTFSSNMIACATKLIQLCSLPVMIQHNSYFVVALHHLQSVLNVLQLADDTVEPVITRITSLLPSTL